MKVNIKKTIKYLLSALLAVILLWFSFRDVQWADFIEGLKGCRWEYVLLSMAAGAFAFWIRALRWRQLLLPVDDSISRTTTFNGINIGNISNFIFPRIGEFVRCGVITRRTTVTYDKVLGTVVLERGWELLVMLRHIIRTIQCHIRWQKKGLAPAAWMGADGDAHPSAGSGRRWCRPIRRIFHGEDMGADGAAS